MASQPKLLVVRSGGERVLQGVAVGALLMLLGYAVRVWPELPATVPTHFGISGAPDAWGGRASLLFLPAIATVFFFALSFLERVPHVYNYPIEVTAANAPRLYALGRQLVLWVKLSLVVVFGLIFRTSVEVALGKATALPGWFLPAALAMPVALVLVFITSMRRARAELRG